MLTHKLSGHLGRGGGVGGGWGVSLAQPVESMWSPRGQVSGLWFYTQPCVRQPHIFPLLAVCWQIMLSSPPTPPPSSPPPPLLPVADVRGPPGMTQNRLRVGKGGSPAALPLRGPPLGVAPKGLPSSTPAWALASMGSSLLSFLFPSVEWENASLPCSHPRGTKAQLKPCPWRLSRSSKTWLLIRIHPVPHPACWAAREALTPPAQGSATQWGFL